MDTSTLDLKPGTRIRWDATLNSHSGSGVVQSVKPWMLTAGRYAGQQARDGRANKGRPLYTVVVADVVEDLDSPVMGGRQYEQGAVAHNGEVHFSAPADKPWEVVADVAARLAELLSTPLHTEAEAEAWVHAMHDIEYGTHPDDPADQIIDARTGEALFTDEQARLYDERMNEAFNLLPDIYATSVEAWGEGLR